MSRNTRAIQELDRLLPAMEPGRNYTNREVDTLAATIGIKAGYSTIGSWLKGQAEAWKLENPSRGIYFRPMPNAKTAGVQTPLPMLTLPPDADPSFRALGGLVEARFTELKEMIAGLKKGAGA